MNKKTKALIFNYLIIVLEIYALIAITREQGYLPIEYYTVDSNIFALITSLLFVIFHKKNYTWVRDLKYISTVCLTVTFLVVIFILTPFANFRYYDFMLKGVLLYHHTLCPIFAILTYMLYEKRSTKTPLCLVFTIIYTIVLVILNLMDKIVGPYFFLMVKQNSIPKTIFWVIIIYSLNYLIGLFLTKFKYKAEG